MGNCELGKLRLLPASSQQIGPDELEKFAKCHSVVGVGHRGDREDLQQTGRVPRALGVGVFEGRQAGRRRAIMSGKRPCIAVVRAHGEHGDGYPRDQTKSGLKPHHVSTRVLYHEAFRPSPIRQRRHRSPVYRQRARAHAQSHPSLARHAVRRKWLSRVDG